MKGKSWTEFLDEQTAPVEMLDESGLKVRVFASEHPGYFGVLNRGKDRLLKDWERINIWIKDNVRETLGQEMYGFIWFIWSNVEGRIWL